MTEAMPFLQKYDITFLRPPTIRRGIFLVERSGTTNLCTARERNGGAVLAPLVYKGSWILLPLRGNKRLRGSLSALPWGY